MQQRIDEDGDGDTDCEDTECRSHPDCRGQFDEVCDNAQDDDGDGFSDCDDSDCFASDACAVAGNELCQNGLDDDEDGFVDCDDPSCQSECEALGLLGVEPEALSEKSVTEAKGCASVPPSLAWMLALGGWFLRTRRR